MGKTKKTTKKKTESLASKGGKARAAKLSRERLSEIGRLGALAKAAAKAIADGREPGREPAVAKYGTPNRPLKIGGIEIPCYVLADGTRVLAQRGLQTGIGFNESGGAQRIVGFLSGLAKKGIDIRGLIARIQNPIRFVPPHGGNLAHNEG